MRNQGHPESQDYEWADFDAEMRRREENIDGGLLSAIICLQDRYDGLGYRE